MALFVACGESSLLPTHNAFLRLLNWTFESVKNGFANNLASIVCSEPNIDTSGRYICCNLNLIYGILSAKCCLIYKSGTSCGEDMLSSSTKDVMKTMEKVCHINTQGCSSKEKNFGDNEGRHAVFNALDTMLKDSLDRLKMMRGSISLAKIGLQRYTCEYTYHKHAAILRYLCLEDKIGAALWLHGKLIQKGFLPDVFTYNHLVNGLCKFGLMGKADWLIKEMLEMGVSPNRVTYNTFIKGYCCINNIDRAFHLFSTMANAGIQPNRVTCNILVHPFCGKNLLKEARKSLEQILNDDDDKKLPYLVTSTIFMDSYFKNGAMIQALSLWDEMLQKSIGVDVVAYNVLVHGFCRSQGVSIAYGFVCEMLMKGLIPDVYTYNTLIGALCKEGKISEACYVLGVMSKMGVMPDEISYKIMIQGLCYNGDVVRAKELLLYMLANSMVPKPLIWNSIIDCYGRYGEFSHALLLKNQMPAFGVQPNVFTYNALIHAEVKSRNIHRAYSIKKEMHLNGIFPDVVSYNMLIGAACNLGCLHWALQLHNEMLERGLEPDIITYTQLIRGHCMTGKMKETEELFAKIQESGILNDHVPVQIPFSKYCKLEEPVMAFNVYQDWLANKQHSDRFT